MSTYIKLYRALLDHELLSNDNTAFVVFTKLLLKANWKTGTYRTGRMKLGLLTNLKATTAWAALHRLANEGALTLTTTGRYTDITICNWWKYQGSEITTVDKSVTRSKPSTDTKQEYKNKENIYTADHEAVLALLNEKTGRNFELVPPAVKRTLSKFTIEQIGAALDRLVKDAWHRPKLGVLSANYLLRVDVIDKFLSAPEVETAKTALDLLTPEQLMKKIQSDKDSVHYGHELEVSEIMGGRLRCATCKTVFT